MRTQEAETAWLEWRDDYGRANGLDMQDRAGWTAAQSTAFIVASQQFIESRPDLFSEESAQAQGIITAAEQNQVGWWQSQLARLADRPGQLGPLGQLQEFFKSIDSRVKLLLWAAVGVSTVIIINQFKK